MVAHLPRIKSDHRPLLLVLNLSSSLPRAIRNDDGNWLFDPADIEDMANVFFQKLYSEIPSPLGRLLSNNFPQLDPVDISFLGRPMSNIEIKEALFDMAPLKAPGSDGFHALFFQKYWDTLEKVVCDWVRKVF
ncbi:hypothetical protein J1N35_002395 [Gossypium stocksii]|uniref:Reverse transcriptase domain-containing protein n=1 Tax=Gossypium stocksii TaxID=47602 RepID=A0A9D3WKV8_9ROSI|nr:hypothetical protein J1N35_002395 [Gossypium stocksii]